MVVDKRVLGHHGSGSRLNRQYKSRKQRPCDFCRKRKVCCIINGSLPCVRCEKLNGGECTFNDGPIKKSRRSQSAPSSAHDPGFPGFRDPGMRDHPRDPTLHSYLRDPARDYSTPMTIVPPLAPYMYPPQARHEYDLAPPPLGLGMPNHSAYQPLHDAPARPHMHMPPQLGTFVVDRPPTDGCKPGWPLQELGGMTQWFPLLPAELRSSHPPPPLQAEPHAERGQPAYPIGDLESMGEDFHDYILKIM